MSGLQREMIEALKKAEAKWAKWKEERRHGSPAQQRRNRPPAEPGVARGCGDGMGVGGRGFAIARRRDWDMDAI
jgi:hypothetical protein